jgi:hypothetical protein
MQLTVITAQKLPSFKVLIGTSTTALVPSVAATRDGSNQYVITVPPALMLPVAKLTIIIVTLDAANITGFTIEACTGNNL